MTLAERFWRWLYAIASEKIKSIYLERTGWDLKCPNCKRWSSVAGITEHSYNNVQRRYNCDGCEALTAWEFHGPVAVPVPVQYFNDVEDGAGK